MLSHYRNTVKYKKFVSVVDCTDFVLFFFLSQQRGIEQVETMFATELTSLLGQLVERCTGIVEVTGSNLIQA